MLMHRNSWFNLKGYNEQSYIALHTDALMVIQAATSGLKEIIIKDPIYHQEHERRYDSNKSNPEYQNAYLFFQREAQNMLLEKKCKLFNNDDWGLNKFNLEETVI
jgi:hypothetical protein